MKKLLLSLGAIASVAAPVAAVVACGSTEAPNLHQKLVSSLNTIDLVKVGTKTVAGKLVADDTYQLGKDEINTKLGVTISELSDKSLTYKYSKWDLPTRTLTIGFTKGTGKDAKELIYTYRIIPKDLPAATQTHTTSLGTKITTKKTISQLLAIKPAAVVDYDVAFSLTGLGIEKIDIAKDDVKTILWKPTAQQLIITTNDDKEHDYQLIPAKETGEPTIDTPIITAGTGELSDPYVIKVKSKFTDDALDKIKQDAFDPFNAVQADVNADSATTGDVFWKTIGVKATKDIALSGDNFVWDSFMHQITITAGQMKMIVEITSSASILQP